MQQRSVVVLFTDLVGSTSQRAALGDDVADVLRREHDAIVSAAADLHGGTWVKSTGDGALVTFTSATAALEAAAAIQANVTARTGEHPFEVRIGATAGEVAVEDDGDVFGMPVNTAARLCDAAVAGQVLVSEDLVRLAGSRCQLETALVGALDLKGLAEAVNAHAVVWSPTAPTHLKETVERAGAAAERAQAAAGFIPASLTSFVGRQAELGELRDLVKQHRLVTLLGPGGMGKTRLAIALATELRQQFPDGVWFVDLSVVTDERAVATQVLKTLGVADTDEGSRDQLMRYLSHRSVLLVIDNCEHLIAAAAEAVHGIVAGAPDVRIVTTSRERLGVPGEHVWETPAIGTDDDSDDGIRLFTQRAESAGARLSAEDRQDVVALCRLLDGMPLAIELASARCRSISPARVLERLRERPDQALGAARTGPDRQRSLDGLVAWSVDLLDERERALFTRLAVFDGPFPAEAAEQVCTDGLVDAFDVIELLSALVDKSLVATTGSHDGTLWYRMLFTIRAHANELLGNDHADLDARLITWLTEHIRELESQLRGPDQVAAHRAFTGVHPLLNGALHSSDDGLDDLRRELADAASYWLWFAGHHRQALALIEPMLVEGDPAIRARLYAWQSLHARALGRPHEDDLAAAEALIAESQVDDLTTLRVATARDPFDVTTAESELASAQATQRPDVTVDFHIRLIAALRATLGANDDDAWPHAVAVATAAIERLGDPRTRYELAELTVWEASMANRHLEALELAEGAIELARACPVEAYEVQARLMVAETRQRLPDLDQKRLAITETEQALRDARRLDLPHLVFEASFVHALTLMNFDRFDEAIATIEEAPTQGTDTRHRLLGPLYHWVGRHEEAVAVCRTWLASGDVGDLYLLFSAPFVVWSLGPIADAVALAQCTLVAMAAYLDEDDSRRSAQLIERSRGLLADAEFDAALERGATMTLAEGAALARRLLTEPSPLDPPHDARAGAA